MSVSEMAILDNVSQFSSGVTVVDESAREDRGDGVAAQSGAARHEELLGALDLIPPPHPPSDEHSFTASFDSHFNQSVTSPPPSAFIAR